MRQTSKAIGILMLSLAMFLRAEGTASAGWLSWDAGFLTGVATASALAPEPFLSKGLTVLAGGAQIIGLVTDAVSAAPRNDQPAVAAGPQPPANTAQASALLAHHSYPAMALTGSREDAALAAGNVAIGMFNTLFLDIASGATVSQRLADVSALGGAIENVATEIDLLGLHASISQSQMESVLATVVATGLPSFETEYLLSAGWNQTEIDGLASYFGHLQLNLADPTGSRSLGAAMHSMAGQLSPVPEPDTWLLLSSGLTTLAVARRRFAVARDSRR
jgi:hypothetical protein